MIKHINTILAAVAVILFAGGILGGYSTLFKDVKAEDVWLTTNDGVKMHGRLLVPEPLPLDKKLPGVVFTHGFMSNLETYELSYGYEIARRGFAVFEVDYRGHGDTGGYLPHWTKSKKQVPPDQPEVDAGVKYLRSLPYVDGERIGVAGHSMGGRASTCAGFLDPTIKATVSIGFPPHIEKFDEAAVPVDINKKLPKNFLMIIGTKDFIYSPENAEKSMLKATNGKSDKSNEFFGSFADGTAREFRVIEGTDHLQETWDPEHLRGTIRWLEKALMDKDDKAEIPLSFNTPRLLFNLALLGAIIGAIPFCSFLRRKLYKDDVREEEPEEEATIHRHGFKIFGALFFLGLMGSLALFLRLSDFFDTPPFDVPLATVNWILAALYGAAIVLLILFFLAKRVIGTDVKFIELGNAGKGVVFAAIIFIYYFVTFNLSMSPHVYDMSPTGREWLVMGRLFLYAIVPMYIISVWIFKLGPATRPKGSLTRRLSVIIFVLVTHYAIFGGVIYDPKKFGLMIFSILILTGILLSSLLFIPGMASRRDPWPAAIFMAMLLAWLAGVIYPFVQIY